MSEAGRTKSTPAHTPLPCSSAPSRCESRWVSQRSTPLAGTTTSSRESTPPTGSRRSSPSSSASRSVRVSTCTASPTARLYAFGPTIRGGGHRPRRGWCGDLQPPQCSWNLTLRFSGPGCAREWVRKVRGHAGAGCWECGSERRGSDGLLSALLSNGSSARARVVKFNWLRPTCSKSDSGLRPRLPREVANQRSSPSLGSLSEPPLGRSCSTSTPLQVAAVLSCGAPCRTRDARGSGVRRPGDSDAGVLEHRSLSVAGGVVGPRRRGRAERASRTRRSDELLVSFVVPNRGVVDKEDI